MTTKTDPPADFDPRPRVERVGTNWVVQGWRCTTCGHMSSATLSACAVCGGAVESATFGPGGTIWASTCLRVRIPGRTPPIALAYVILDDGPRVLAHTPGGTPLAVGSRVNLDEPTRDGDVAVVPTNGDVR